MRARSEFPVPAHAHHTSFRPDFPPPLACRNYALKFTPLPFLPPYHTLLTFPLEPPPFHHPDLKTIIDSDRRACLQVLPQFFAPLRIQAYKTRVDTRAKAGPMARQKRLIECEKAIRLKPDRVRLIAA